MPEQQAPSPEPHKTPNPADREKILLENQKKNASGLSWDETEPKPGENFNRVTEMGEAD